MDSSVAQKYEIWFLYVCHDISNAVYLPHLCCVKERLFTLKAVKAYREIHVHFWTWTLNGGVWSALGFESFTYGGRNAVTCKGRYTLSVKLSRFTVRRHIWRKNWVNCAILTGNSAGLKTVLSSRLSHRKLRNLLRESHSFPSLPADTTMAFQGTSVSSNSFSRWASHDIFLFKYHFLLHILRFLFFSDNIMADVATKQQTTALFLSTKFTRTRRHTELTKKTDVPDWKPVLCLRTFS